MNTSLELGAQVAGGRLATVHRGVLSGRAVAVKRARADVPGAAPALRREARILTAVSCPAVVPVLDLIDDPDAPALVLGWADGGSLADLLTDGPLPASDVLHLLRPLAEGLDALHAAGVAHLDVTVGNVLLAAPGPFLIDPAPPGAGTPGYADPAVAAGAPPSARSDVFGLAACAHVALTGRTPRVAGGVAIGLHLAAPVAEVLAAGLHPDPGRRPASASAFVDRLSSALAGSAPPAAAAGTAPPAPSGRPVARAAPPPSLPARTWPFDRWQEEADAAEHRRMAVAEAIGQGPSARRRKRAVVLGGALVLVVSGAVGGAAGLPFLRSGGPWRQPPQVRPSAHDSTRRPPAARPPPTTTPGGRP